MRTNHKEILDALGKVLDNMEDEEMIQELRNTLNAQGDQKEITSTNPFTLIREASNSLHQYWDTYFLLFQIIKEAGSFEKGKQRFLEVIDEIAPSYREQVEEALEAAENNKEYSL